MNKSYIVMGLLMSSIAFGMQQNKSNLNHRNAMAAHLLIIRTTVVAQAVAEDLYAQLQITPVESQTPAKLALIAGENAAEKAEKGELNNDSDIKEIIVTTFASYFRNVSKNRIMLLIDNEFAAIDNHTTRALKSK